MGIISGDQFSGWFSNMGQGGVILQNVLTVIMPIIMCIIAEFLIYHLVKAVMAKASAENKEQKKAVWARIFGLGAAVILVVIGPTLLLYFMNTIGKTVQIDSKGSKTTTTKQSINLISNIVNLKNMSYNMNITKVLII